MAPQAAGPSEAPGHWVLGARGLIAGALAGAVAGLVLIHTTAAVFVEWGRGMTVLESLAASFAPRAFPLLIYHVAIGAVIGLAITYPVRRVFAGQLDHARREAEAEIQLMRVQKMESVGRLAAGVAHDVNNYLSALNLGLYLAEQAIGEPEKARRHLGDAAKASEKTGKLAQQLLTFARQKEIRPKRIDVNAVFADLRPLLQSMLPGGVELREELGAPIFVEADAGQFEQVLVNLVVNARDAMPGGGVLRVATREETLAEASPSQAGDLGPGRYAVVDVSDTGTGIDPKVIERIFEPFFTTKGEDKGTGLGLATSLGVVRQHGGGIRVASRPGHGTTFKVYLPCAAPAGRDAVT